MTLNPELIVIILLTVALVVTLVLLLLSLSARRRDALKLTALAELENDHARLSAENEALRDRVARHDSDFAALREQNDQRGRDLAEVRTRLELAGEEMNKLSATLDAEKTRSGELSDDAGRRERENHDLNAQLTLETERTADLRRQLSEIEAQFQAIFGENKNLGEQNATLSANLAAAEQKLATMKEEFELLRTKSQVEFENLANRILETKSARFTTLNRENIEQILLPLKRDITEFKTKVEEVYHAESQERSRLDERVRQLVEKTDLVSAEANNLATALKGQVKTQGNWGEMILERILETNGLVRDREFRVQFPHKTDDGHQQFLDCVVELPDNRKLIIDSKVTLTAYERYCAAEDEQERQKYLTEHLTALRNHVEQLSAKRYDELTDATGFVMLFVPVEPAYLTAVQHDTSLWNRAYEKRIILISPTTLMAAVKLVADLWSRDQQSRNALAIAKQGEKLYDKFAGFVKSLEEIGTHINRTQSAYDSAIKQLRDGRGNLIGQAEKLRELGIKTSKSLPASLREYDTDDEIG